MFAEEGIKRKAGSSRRGHAEVPLAEIAWASLMRLLEVASTKAYAASAVIK